MSIKLILQAFEAEIGNPIRKLIFIKLCDQANDDGECWPSIKSIAKHCECSERTVQRSINELEIGGFISIESRYKAGKQTSNVYQILGCQRVAGVSESHPHGCQRVTPMGDTESPKPVSINLSVRTKEKNKQKKLRELKTFTEWADELRATGQRLIPADHPIHESARQMGIPDEFLRLAWKVFTDYYTNDNHKKYKDWRAVFSRAVKEDWLKLWAFGREGECFLTTKGKMAMNRMGAAT